MSPVTKRPSYNPGHESGTALTMAGIPIGTKFPRTIPGGTCNFAGVSSTGDVFAKILQYNGLLRD